MKTKKKINVYLVAVDIVAIQKYYLIDDSYIGLKYLINTRNIYLFFLKVNIFFKLISTKLCEYNR